MVKKLNLPKKNYALIFWVKVFWILYLTIFPAQFLVTKAVSTTDNKNQKFSDKLQIFANGWNAGSINCLNFKFLTSKDSWTVNAQIIRWTIIEVQILTY